MAHILITAGPTRQYLDPVRYLSNASSGRMGLALCDAALTRGHQVTVISGPVVVQWPASATVVSVMTTEEMLEAATIAFPGCDGVIGAAAPCDFRPVKFQTNKIKKQGDRLTIEFESTPDIMGALGELKTGSQWSVAFALETETGQPGIANAIAKLKRKKCDQIVLNGPAAIDSDLTSIRVFDSESQIVAEGEGEKSAMAELILSAVEAMI